MLDIDTVRMSILFTEKRDAGYSEKNSLHHGGVSLSVESATAFYERLEKDLELQEKLKELKTKENIARYVKGELGYEFTLEEMQKVIFEKNPEMTDEELEAVVGGSVIGTIALILLAGPAFIVGLAAGVAAA